MVHLHREYRGTTDARRNQSTDTQTDLPHCCLKCQPAAEEQYSGIAMGLGKCLGLGEGLGQSNRLAERTFSPRYGIQKSFTTAWKCSF